MGRTRRFTSRRPTSERTSSSIPDCAALAELYLNYLEHVTVMADSFGKANRPALDRFVTSALAASPVMRRRLAEQRDFYSPALQRRLPAGD